MKNFLLRDISFYLIKFLAAFCILYFGTKMIIGLTTPDNYYSHFVDTYFNYPSWLRWSLLYGTKFILWLAGYATYFPNQYKVKVVNGVGVKLVYSCLGIGVMSFWSAFVFANETFLFKKIKWGLGGLFVVWFINVLRLTLLIIFANKHWNLGIDNHTMFTIGAYIAIFVMIYFFDKSIKKDNLI